MSTLASRALLLIMPFLILLEKTFAEPRVAKSASQCLEAVTITDKSINEAFFMDLIQNNSELYESFLRLKEYSFLAESNITTFKRQKASGYVYQKIAHCNGPQGYHNKQLEYVSGGQVHTKKGRYRLFTLQMFDYFFSNASNSDFTGTSAHLGQKNFSKELYKKKVKGLVFNPGKRVSGIPFLSSRTEIFGPRLRKFYDAEIRKIKFGDTQAYEFSYRVKPVLEKNNSLILQSLVDVFEQKNFRILSRQIHLKYQNFLLSFDIKIWLERTLVNGEYLPTTIKYDGLWQVVFKREEKANFVITHSNYVSKMNDNQPCFCK